MPQPQPKPLEYQLVDLLGEDGVSEAEVEAIRVLLILIAGKRRRDAVEAEMSEIEALRHDLQRLRERENRYLNALLGISSLEGEAADLAASAVYGDREPASRIEAATAGETRSGSTVGESPAPEGGDAQDPSLNQDSSNG